MSPLSAIANEFATLATPALLNIYFAALALPFGFMLAVPLAIAKGSRNAIVRRLARGYIYFFRGTPFFIQLFAFYSLALSLNLSLWKPLGVDGFVLHPLFLGPMILGLNSAAYTGEILHGALQTVPRGEVEAARAFGMDWAQRFRRVVWPHVIRLAWPAYTNEVVFTLQATALIYFTLPVIGEQKDLMNKAGELFERDYNVFLHYSVAALYFLVISLAIFWVFSLIYKQLTRHMPGAIPMRFSFRRALR
jgi:polar amino acid transport system permease protein